MNGRLALAALVAVMLSGTGCLATKPHVRAAVQTSETRTQEQLRTVDHRLDTLERELSEDRAQLTNLTADVRQLRAVAENTARQTDQLKEVAVRAEGAARDALQAASLPPAAPKPPEPVAAKPETFVVHFGFAEWSLDHSGRMTLLRALKRLQQNPALVARLEGYADSVGSPSLNLKLSQRRADEVWRWLVGNGVKRNRIETLAKGEGAPAAPGHDQRRVAITLLPPPQ